MHLKAFSINLPNSSRARKLCGLCVKSKKKKKTTIHTLIQKRAWKKIHLQNLNILVMFRHSHSAIPTVPVKQYNVGKVHTNRNNTFFYHKNVLYVLITHQFPSFTVTLFLRAAAIDGFIHVTYSFHIFMMDLTVYLSPNLSFL